MQVNKSVTLTTQELLDALRVTLNVHGKSHTVPLTAAGSTEVGRQFDFSPQIPPQIPPHTPVSPFLLLTIALGEIAKVEGTKSLISFELKLKE